jgi:hypothetical protein
VRTVVCFSRLCFTDGQRAKDRRAREESGELRTELDTGPALAFGGTAWPLASSATVNSVRAKAVGHMAPSSRFALSLKPNVAAIAKPRVPLPQQSADEHRHSEALSCSRVGEQLGRAVSAPPFRPGRQPHVAMACSCPASSGGAVKNHRVTGAVQVIVSTWLAQTGGPPASDPDRSGTMTFQPRSRSALPIGSHVAGPNRGCAPARAKAGMLTSFARNGTARSDLPPGACPLRTGIADRAYEAMLREDLKEGTPP